jgi:hypothetical protein
MNARIIFSSCLLAILIGSLALTFKSVHVIRAAERARAAQDQKNESLQTEITASERQLRAIPITPKLSAEIEKRAPEKNAPADVAGATNHNPSAGSSGKRPVNGRMLIANDPARSARYYEASRTSMEARHGALFKALGWSADQIEKFKDMKAQSEQNMRDLNATADAQGLGKHDKVYLALWQAEAEKRMKIEAETMGSAEALEKYNEFNRVEDARELAMKLAVSAVYAETPLTSAQVERVTEILAANSQRLSNGRVDPGTVNWPAVYAAAQETLSPAQLNALQQLRQHQELQRQVAAVVGSLTGRKAPEPIQDTIRAAGPLPKVPGS